MPRNVSDVPAGGSFRGDASGVAASHLLLIDIADLREISSFQNLKRKRVMLNGKVHPSNTHLKNKEEICAFFRQDWKTIKQLIDEEGFSPAKIGKNWESDKVLISEWQRKRILEACQQ